MAIQFSDSVITDKVTRVAKATGLSVPAVMELALDLWLAEMAVPEEHRDRMAARLAQLDG